MQDNKKVGVVFYLHDGDTITIEGGTVAEIFFEFHARFPDLISFKNVEFSGSGEGEKTMNAKKFAQLCRKYGV